MSKWQATLTADHEVVLEDDLTKWAEACEDRYVENKDGSHTDLWRVNQTIMDDGMVVSTVFLGIDMSFMDGSPAFFETMVFPRKGEWRETYQDRCGTWLEAVAMHDRAVKGLKEGTLDLYTYEEEEMEEDTTDV